MVKKYTEYIRDADDVNLEIKIFVASVKKLL